MNLRGNKAPIPPGRTRSQAASGSPFSRQASRLPEGGSYETRRPRPARMGAGRRASALLTPGSDHLSAASSRNPTTAPRLIPGGRTGRLRSVRESAALGLSPDWTPCTGYPRFLPKTSANSAKSARSTLRSRLRSNGRRSVPKASANRKKSARSTRPSRLKSAPPYHLGSDS